MHGDPNYETPRIPNPDIFNDCSFGGNLFINSLSSDMKKKKIQIRNKIAKIKKPTHSQVKNIVDCIFNTWIKYRDDWTCVQCQTKHNITAGHVIPKVTGDSIRFREDNCFAQCSGHNQWHNHSELKYRDWFKGVYGENKLKELEAIARTTLKYSTQDLLNLFHKYEKKLLKEYDIEFAVWSKPNADISRKIRKVFPKYYE